VTLEFVRVEDSFNPGCLEYIGADPVPDAIAPDLGHMLWMDITTYFGDLGPGECAQIEVRFRAKNPCFDCNEVMACEPLLQLCDEARVCFQIDPEPPRIEVAKWAPDPIVCAGDEVRFSVRVTNTGTVPIVAQATDTYDTNYLTFLEPSFFGPDDGELTADLPGGPPLPPGGAIGGDLVFRAEAPTASTVNVFRAMANHRPETERQASAAVTIVDAAGPCGGNLVANGGFESGLADWTPNSGTPRVGAFAHSGSRSLLLGILADEPDAYREDNISQSVDIPADAHHVELRLWYYVDNLDNDVRENGFIAYVIGFDAHGFGHVT